MENRNVASSPVQHPGVGGASSLLESTNLSGLSRPAKRRLAGLIEGWRRCKCFRLFLEPVDVVQMECPTYYQVIKEPMDLQTMETKLEADAYLSERDFFLDAMRIFVNCRTFNQPDTAAGRFVIGLCEEAEAKFYEDWRKASKDPSLLAIIKQHRALYKDSKHKPGKPVGERSVSSGIDDVHGDALHALSQRLSSKLASEHSISSPGADATAANPNSTSTEFEAGGSGKSWALLCRDNILRPLKGDRYAYLFLTPVLESPELPLDVKRSYAAVIPRPRDYGTIWAKLSAREYSHPHYFFEDMFLVRREIAVYANCMAFNPPYDEQCGWLHRVAVKCRDKFFDRWDSDRCVIRIKIRLREMQRREAFASGMDMRFTLRSWRRWVARIQGAFFFQTQNAASCAAPSLEDSEAQSALEAIASEPAVASALLSVEREAQKASERKRPCVSVLSQAKEQLSPKHAALCFFQNTRSSGPSPEEPRPPQTVEFRAAVADLLGEEALEEDVARPTVANATSSEAPSSEPSSMSERRRAVQSPECVVEKGLVGETPQSQEPEAVVSAREDSSLAMQTAPEMVQQHSPSSTHLPATSSSPNPPFSTLLSAHGIPAPTFASAGSQSETGDVGVGNAQSLEDSCAVKETPHEYSASAPDVPSVGALPSTPSEVPATSAPSPRLSDLIEAPPGSQLYAFGAEAPALPHAQSPSQPSHPIQSFHPVQPSQPFQSIDQVPPIQPVEPIQPIQPIPSIQPIQPIPSIQPIQPIPSIQPIQPIQPLQPVPPVFDAPAESSLSISAVQASPLSLPTMHAFDPFDGFSSGLTPSGEVEGSEAVVPPPIAELSVQPAPSTGFFSSESGPSLAKPPSAEELLLDQLVRKAKRVDFLALPWRGGGISCPLPAAFRANVSPSLLFLVADRVGPSPTSILRTENCESAGEETCRRDDGEKGRKCACIGGRLAKSTKQTGKSIWRPMKIAKIRDSSVKAVAKAHCKTAAGDLRLLKTAFELHASSEEQEEGQVKLDVASDSKEQPTGETAQRGNHGTSDAALRRTFLSAALKASKEEKNTSTSAEAWSCLSVSQLPNVDALKRTRAWLKRLGFALLEERGTDADKKEKANSVPTPELWVSRREEWKGFLKAKNGNCGASPSFLSSASRFPIALSLLRCVAVDADAASDERKGDLQVSLHFSRRHLDPAEAALSLRGVYTLPTRMQLCYAAANAFLSTPKPNSQEEANAERESQEPPCLEDVLDEPRPCNLSVPEEERRIIRALPETVFKSWRSGEEFPGSQVKRGTVEELETADVSTRLSASLLQAVLRAALSRPQQKEERLDVQGEKRSSKSRRMGPDLLYLKNVNVWLCALPCEIKLPETPSGEGLLQGLDVYVLHSPPMALQGVSAALERKRLEEAREEEKTEEPGKGGRCALRLFNQTSLDTLSASVRLSRA